MTDRIALVLGFLIAAAIAADLLLNGGMALLFLARKTVALVDYVVFWR